jgi:hypothetical protein
MTLRITEVNIDVSRQGKSPMGCEFFVPKPGQELQSSVGNFLACLVRAEPTVWASLLVIFIDIT